MSLVLRPWTCKKALPFIRHVHRRLPQIQGALWALVVRQDEIVIGAAVVGHPARALMERGKDFTLSVLRVAVIKGYPNACSMLYGGCSRAARGMGADNLVTYTHLDERGISLKASGWVFGGFTTGGEHDRESRPRASAVDPEQKKRWWAPWSLRAKQERKMGMMLFEYGSMLPGCENHETLRNMGAVLQDSNVWIEGFILLDCGFGPGIAPEHGHAVRGQVFEVPATAVRTLDRFHGHPSVFKRVTVERDNGSMVVAYVFQGEAHRALGISTGDWLDYVGVRSASQDPNDDLPF